MDMKKHILIVDDDKDIRIPLSKYIGNHDFRISMACNGKEADAIIATSSIDLIVLDIMMPGEDGLSICKRIQQVHQIPIILLTALGEDTDRIVGLEVGADDYLTKPFNPRELLARIKSVIRRSQMLPRSKKQHSGIVKFGEWQMELSQKEIIRSDDVVIRLSSGEYTLLISFIDHAGITLSRDQLLDLTKGRESQLYDRSIDNQISRLRQKLETDPKNPKYIQTKWGGGYVFTPAVELQD